MARWAICVGGRPRTDLPSDRRMIADGTRRPASSFWRASTPSERASASPVAVPPLGCSALIAARTAARSVVGLSARRADWLKATRPTRTASGTWPRKRSAAARAARSRLGGTSVACIEPE